MIAMAEARTPEEREAVFRFWYSVYVEEMGRYRDSADHARQVLRDDPEDDHSRIAYASDEGEVVAACRLSWGGDGFSDRQVRQYQLGPFLDELPPEIMSIGERTMVAPSHRGGSVYVDLAYTVTPISDELGILLSFGASEPHLVSYYAQFGQRPYASRQTYSEESGYIIPTLALVRGLEPFGDDVPSCLRAAAQGSPTVRNAALDGDEQFNAALRVAAVDARSARSIFAGCTDDEIERCAARGTLLTCAAGDHVIKRGGTARNPYVVLTGRVEVRGARAWVLGPGEVFGEEGWMSGSDRWSDVVVLDDDTCIAAMSTSTLASLETTASATAAKLNANTAAQLRARRRP